MEARFFHWGGNLDPNSPVYIKRPEDDKLPEHIAAGDFVTVLAPRQMGKTSLLLRVRRLLTEAGMAIAYVDLSPAREESLESWYAHLSTGIAEQVLPGGDHPPLPQSHLEFVQFLRAVSTQLGNTRLCIMLDEVGTVPEDMSDAFFGNVRYVFSNRQVKPEFRFTNFVLCGTFQPRDLIKNPANSPFNISKTLRMSDLTRDGVRRLVGMLERMGVYFDEDIPDVVHDWTGGQPYLTQRLCAIFEEWKIPISGPEVVERAIQDLMMDDNNLDHIVHRLHEEAELVPWLERVLIRKESIRFNRMTNQRLARLELIGLIKPAKDGSCKIRNRIYHDLLLNNFFSEREGEHVPDLDASTDSEQAARPADSQEVTAVSIDVVDSTLLKQDQDKVAVTYTFQQYFQYVQNLARRWGGQVKDAAGDGVMCIFSSADSALRCAVELQENLPGFNRRHNRLNGPLALRIGLNTGHVLTRDLKDYRMTRSLYDYTLDLSGKLQKGISGGEIALTNHTVERLSEPIQANRQELWPEYNITVYVLNRFQETSGAQSASRA